MSVYNEIVYNQGVYGVTSSADISDVVFIQGNLVQIVFLKELVVNASYYQLVGMSISTISGSPINLKGILQLNKNVQATNVVNVITDRAAEGSEFFLSIPSYLTRDTLSTTPHVSYVKYTRTKIENEIRSMPSHFDKSLNSNLTSILTAIGSSDEIIGGSRNDLV